MEMFRLEHMHLKVAKGAGITKNLDPKNTYIRYQTRKIYGDPNSLKWSVLSGEMFLANVNVNSQLNSAPLNF
jgi:hypothetical protein